MVMHSFVQSSPDLHGLVLVGERNSFDLEKGCIVVDVEHLCILWTWMNSCNFFLGPDHANAKGGFKKGIGRALVVSERLGAEAFEALCGQTHVFQNGWHAGKGQHASDLENAASRGEHQGFGDFGGGLGFFAPKNGSMSGSSGQQAFCIGNQFKESVLKCLLGVGGHKGAFALAAKQQVLLGQLVHGFAHRALTDLKARGQLKFAWNHLTGLPFTCFEALQNQHLDLLVQRAKGRHFWAERIPFGQAVWGGIGEVGKLAHVKCVFFGCPHCNGQMASLL